MSQVHELPPQPLPDNILIPESEVFATVVEVDINEKYGRMRQMMSNPPPFRRPTIELFEYIPSSSLQPSAFRLFRGNRKALEEQGDTAEELALLAEELLFDVCHANPESGFPEPLAGGSMNILRTRFQTDIPHVNLIKEEHLNSQSTKWNLKDIRSRKILRGSWRLT